MSYLQTDYAKNTYQQHQQKQTQQLFPQYSYNKKNGSSPIKQSSQTVGEPASISVSSTSLQTSDTNKNPKQQYPQPGSSMHSITGIQIGSESRQTNFVPTHQATMTLTTPQWETHQHETENSNGANYAQSSPKFVQTSLTSKEALTKPISRFSITAFNNGDPITTTQDLSAPISSSRIDLSQQTKDFTSSALLPSSQTDTTPSNRQQSSGLIPFSSHGTQAMPFFNQNDLSINYQSEQSNSQKQQGNGFPISFTSKIPSITPTQQSGAPFKINDPLQHQLLSSSIKPGLTHFSQAKGPIDPLVQSVNLQRKRSKSPSFELKVSTNMGAAKKYPLLLSQSSQSTSNSKLTTSQNIQASYFTSPVQSHGSTALRVRDLQATSPDGNRTTSQLNHSSSLSPKSKQSNSSSISNNYYKVASQIRRNIVKDSQSPGGINSEKRDLAACSLTGSTFLGHASQYKAGIQNGSGLSTPFSGLALSQNVGRATVMSTAHLKLPQASRSPAGNIKRQKSSGSVEGRNLAEPTDPRKRFTVVEKLNEKYTKKMIIDLCNYMNTSQEGQPASKKEEKPNSSEGSRDNFHLSQQSKNSNMNMLDMLSKQRVLQRSVSNSKRMDSKLQGIKDPSCDPNSIKKDKLIPNANASTKRLSFRFSEKPWENNSFGSRCGSFSAMRSSSNQGTHQPAQNSAKNWNINGSQNFSSTSHPTEITASVVQIGTKSTAAGDLDASASKGIINKGTFILKGFNDSQEIHSSRNFQIEKKNGGIGESSSNSHSLNYTKGNVLTKNITSADLASNSPNPNSKYKFTSGHLSKPTTSSNSFAKSQQHQQQPSSNQLQHQQQQQELLTSLSSRSQTKAEIPQKGSTSFSQVKNSITQPSSPQPNSSSFPSSKSSTKSDIKKSLLSENCNRSSQQRDQLSNNTCSQSFEDQENNGKECELDEDDDLDCQDEDGDLENDFDDEADDAFGGEDNKSQISEHSSGGGVSPYQTAPGYNTAPHQHQPYQHTFNQPNGRGTPYNFDAQLEHHPEVQINIEELKKERTKLIRKIMSTFKIKNKALSTSQEYYKILHVVGKGAFAKVCLAIQLLTGKLVAIKLIDKQILRSDSAKKRVLQEVHILKKLNGHKHVLKLLEVFENRKLIFIVTEYFHGNDLMKMMKERNGAPYSEDQVRNMLAQILSGLRYIHGNMVLHRDIKLDNLLVDSSMNLKIIDFGISRVIQKDQRMTEQCGTPAFLAPEIIANKGYEGFASDFWSLGVLIYILLYGRVPFKGNSLNELHKNILNGILPKDEMKEVNVSLEAQDLIYRILRIKVKERIGLESIVQSSWMRGFPIPDGNDGGSFDSQNSQQQSYGFFHNGGSDNDPIASAASSIKSSLAMQNESFDERIIGYIESFGYSREYILRCLVKQNLSHVNAIYKLLKKP